MRYFRVVLSLAVGGALVVLLLGEVDLQVLRSAFRSIDWRFTTAAFAVYLTANIARAERFSLLVERKVSRRAFLRIVLLQNFFNLVLPFRLGELSYVALVRKHGGIGIGENIASLVAARAMDLTSIAVLFLAGLAAVFRSVAYAPVLFSAAVAMAAGAGAALGIAILRSGRAQGSERRWYDEVIAGFRSLRRRRALVVMAALSLAIWALVFSGGILLLWGSGLRLGTGEGIFVYSFPVFVSMTPLVMFGGFGSYEASFVLPLALLGRSLADAIPVSIAVHLEELAFLLVLAAAAYLTGIFARGARFPSTTHES